MPVVDTAVVHRDGEEARRAERAHVGGDLLEVPPPRLAAVVDAADDLGPWLRGGLGRRRQGGQRVERDRGEPPLIREVQQPAAGDGVAGVDRALEALHLADVEGPEVGGREPEELCELVEHQGARQRARPARGRMPIAQLRPERREVGAAGGPSDAPGRQIAPPCAGLPGGATVAPEEPSAAGVERGPTEFARERAAVSV